MTSWRSASIAFILLLPIGLMLLSIVLGVSGIETVYKLFLTDDGETQNMFGRAFMLGGLIALPVALVVALFPWFRSRQLPFANLVAALLALLIILPIAYGLGEEFYRCEIAQVPNCD